MFLDSRIIAHDYILETGTELELSYNFGRAHQDLDVEEDNRQDESEPSGDTELPKTASVSEMISNSDTFDSLPTDRQTRGSEDLVPDLTDPAPISNVSALVSEVPLLQPVVPVTGTENILNIASTSISNIAPFSNISNFASANSSNIASSVSNIASSSSSTSNQASRISKALVENTDILAREGGLGTSIEDDLDAAELELDRLDRDMVGLHYQVIPIN